VNQIDREARDVLLLYPWPGNVRELSHVIERAVLWSREDTLRLEHLSLTAPRPPELEEKATEAAEDGRPAEVATDNSALPPTGVDLTQWERTLIERAMREAGGNQTKAAQRLGISRDTLRYRLKKFGIRGG
jgi:DNA-binding NtrC family response regulator